MSRFVKVRALGNNEFGFTSVVDDVKAGSRKEPFRVKKILSIRALNQRDVEQTMLEIQYISQLDHPGVAKLFEAIREKSSLIIIREYCENRLDAIISNTAKEGGSLEESLVLNWFVQMLFGTYFLHDKQILHKNLKPGNIIIHNNTAKVADIGLSRFLLRGASSSSLFPFTPHYLAPEVVTYRGYRQASDVWSLGCILYEMCSLRHAFDFSIGANATSVLFRIANVGMSEIEMPKTIPPQIQQLLRQILVRDPNSRPTCADLLRSSLISKHIQQLLRIQGNVPASERDENFKEMLTNIAINPRKRDTTFTTIREYIKRSGQEMIDLFLPKKKKKVVVEQVEKTDFEEEEEEIEVSEHEDEEFLRELERMSAQRVRTRSQISLLEADYYGVPISYETRVPHASSWMFEQNDTYERQERQEYCRILDTEFNGLMKLQPPQNQPSTSPVDTRPSSIAGNAATKDQPEDVDSDEDEVYEAIKRRNSAKFDPTTIADPYEPRVGRAKYATLVAKAKQLLADRYDLVHAAVAKKYANFAVEGASDRARSAVAWSVDKDSGVSSFMVEQIVFFESFLS